MNEKCPKCGTITATGSLLCQYFDAGFEPYENGKEEQLKSGENEISVSVHLSAQYCEKCKAFTFIEVSDAPMVEPDSICNDCDFLKHSEGENSWQDSIGCYKWKEPVDNKCDEKVKSRDLGQLMGDK